MSAPVRGLKGTAWVESGLRCLELSALEQTFVKLSRCAISENGHNTGAAGALRRRQFSH